MPSPAILDVAIGIAFVYLFLSLICSVVNEGIAAIFSLRAKNLVRGINSLFSKSTAASGRPLVDALYAHGLIRGLYLDPSEVDDANPLGASSSGKPGPTTPLTSSPAGLPAQLAALEQTARGVVGDLLVENLRFPSVLALVKKARVNLPAYIPANVFSTALIDIVSPPDPTRARVLGDIREAIANLPPSPTKQALLSLVADTQKDVAEFQQKVESWFNDSMDRAAGWYKKRTQRILLGIALVITLALNVDTIKLAQGLWTNPTVAKATADLAEKYVSSNSPNSPGDLQSQAETLINVGQQLPFAFGWRAWPSGGTLFWAESAAGWLITVLALSLGAPFWFDTLNKFMSLRSAVKPKQKSQAESSKDG